MQRFCSGLVFAFLFSLLSACSFQAALDKMVKPERQREIIDIASRICSDPESVRSQLHPEIAATLDQNKAALPRECPGEGASWQLASYSWKSNATPDLKERQEEVVVVGAKDGKWSTIELRFYAQNDQPLQISLWNIVASDKPPEALAFIDGYNRAAKIARIAVPVAILLIAGLVFWLIRRSRARRAA